jgi:hypothetical protein
VDDHQSTYLTKLGKKTLIRKEELKEMVLLLAALCLLISAHHEQKF